MAREFDLPVLIVHVPKTRADRAVLFPTTALPARLGHYDVQTGELVIDEHAIKGMVVVHLDKPADDEKGDA